jgi:adenylyltransferase/sulfurtransferase
VSGPGAPALTEAQIRRYARHVLLDEVGGAGQERLLAAKVLVVGAGGLGSPLLLYLAAAGVGTLGIIDDDVVELGNLQRQVVHTTARLGRPKVESAREAIAAINPDVRVVCHPARLTADNAPALVAAYDVVADGSDNFPTRFLLNDACYFARKPLVSGAVLRFSGQVATFKAYRGDAGAEGRGPCYRCLFRAPPPADDVPACAEAGVLGAFCGVIGSLQATEVIKEILGIGESLAGFLLVLDGLDASIRKIRVRPDPGCPLCGEAPGITDPGGAEPSLAPAAR